MPNTENESNEQTNSDKKFIPSWAFYKSGIFWIVFTTAIATVFLYYSVFYLNKNTDDKGTTFINSLLLLWTLAVIAVQAYIQAMNDSLIETRNLLKQNERAIKASEDQASTTRAIFENSKESFAISERAYIGIKDMTLIAPLAVGQYPSVRIMFLNGGKTPAWNFVTKFRFVIHKDSALVALKQFPVEWESNKEIGTFIPSGIDKRVEFMQDQIMIDTLTLEVINREMVKLYCFGEAHYKDFQHNEQIFPIIATYDPSEKGFTDCNE